jgi:hypothetical protein
MALSYDGRFNRISKTVMKQGQLLPVADSLAPLVSMASSNVEARQIADISWYWQTR